MYIHKYVEEEKYSYVCVSSPKRNAFRINYETDDKHKHSKRRGRSRIRKAAVAAAAAEK